MIAEMIASLRRIVALSVAALTLVLVASCNRARQRAGQDAAPRDSSQLRDSAFGPKYMVDSTGKVTPIRPPR